MSITLTATIHISDDQLDVLRAAVASGPASMQSATASTPTANAELPASWTLVDEQRGTTYTWGSHVDVYEPFRIYEGTIRSKTWRLAIGRCDPAKTRGRARKYVITHLIGPGGGKRAVAEFLETDDHAETSQMIAIIKGNGGGGRQYDPDEELPEFYDRYKIEIYRDRVDRPGSYNKLALVVDENDHAAMLSHTLFQVITRGLDDQ